MKVEFAEILKSFSFLVAHCTMKMKYCINVENIFFFNFPVTVKKIPFVHEPKKFIHLSPLLKFDFRAFFTCGDSHHSK